MYYIVSNGHKEILMVSDPVRTYFPCDNVHIYYSNVIVYATNSSYTLLKENYSHNKSLPHLIN